MVLINITTSLGVLEDMTHSPGMSTGSHGD